MLIPGFYTIKDFQVSENQVHAQISLNPNHDVYEGHFSGQPVVPGVIQLQIIKELMEKSVNEKLLLNRMVFAKYLRMIVPGTSPVLNLQITYRMKESARVFTAVIKDDRFVFTKVKGSFIAQCTGDFSRRELSDLS